MKFEQNRVIWCSASKKGCNCPTVEKIEDGHYVITDDFGGSIKLTRDDALYMKETFKDAMEKLGV